MGCKNISDKKPRHRQNETNNGEYITKKEHIERKEDGTIVKTVIEERVVVDTNSNKKQNMKQEKNKEVSPSQRNNNTDLQNDPNNVVYQNNQKNIEYFNTNIMPFCTDRDNTSKILDKITNEGLKEQFKKIFNITDITNNYDSKEEGDIHNPNITCVKDNINNIQINTKKAEIEHQNVVDNDIDYLNGNDSIEPIIKEENESFNTPKEKSKNVQYNYNHNLKNNNIPPNNKKVTRSQITAIIRNINDPIKQEELLQMFEGTPKQNRKRFIQKILSICSIIGNIKEHIEILESILTIKINEKVHNVKTKVQSPVNNTNNFQPLPKNQTRNCK